MTVSTQIIEVLDALCAKVGIVIDWTSENVIPYVTELAGKYITFEIATSIAWLVISIVFLVAGWKFAFWAHRKVNDADISILVFGVMVAASFLCAYIIGKQIFDIIKCATIPELVLFKAVQALMN